MTSLGRNLCVYSTTYVRLTLILDFFFPTCSHDGKYLTSGSENQCVFLWRTQYESSGANIAARRKDRNNFYEAIKGDYTAK